jgi:hypothetical protein
MIPVRLFLLVLTLLLGPIGARALPGRAGGIRPSHRVPGQ